MYDVQKNTGSEPLPTLGKGKISLAPYSEEKIVYSTEELRMARNSVRQKAKEMREQIEREMQGFDSYLNSLNQ